MKRPLPLAFLMLAPFLSGCFGDDGEPQETASPTGTGSSPTNETAALNVSIASHTRSANVTEPIQVSWRVSAGANQTAGNQSAANRTPIVERTSVQWAHHSVPNPRSPSDYGNTSGERLATTPGNFSTNFTVARPGTVFLRAYAQSGGVDYWSREVQVEVGGQLGAVETVQVRSAVLPHLSGFEPDEVTIKKGDAVVWENMDDATHTATSVGGTFNTGDIPGGQSSAPVYFNVTGAYDYRCSYHPQTMAGTITVA